MRGHVEDGWGKVADVFRANFEGSPGEVGAACCVYVGGRPVVDLWGGLADREANRPWGEDTIALVASTTKGATAICAHLLAQRGELDLDAPVVKYWPEFGAAGKEHIPVRWLLSHQAGLPVVDGPLTFEDAWYLLVDGEQASVISGDGLIISTPVGSTAHSLSAGGPILGQELSAFVLTPICPHSLTSRPVVDSATKVYTILLRRTSSGAVLIMDGQEEIPLTADHRVTVRMASG